MDNVTAILIGGLGAGISWGVSDFFAAKSAKKVGPTLACSVINVIGSLIFVIFYLIFLMHSSQKPLDNTGFLYSISSGVLLSLGAASFFRGLEKGPVSIVSPLTSLYPLVTTLLALVIFKAHLTGGQLTGIFLVVIGVLAASGLLNSKKSERKITAGPQYGLLAAFLWGIGFSLLAQGIFRLGWQLSSLVEFSSVTLTFVVLTPLIKGREVIDKKAVRKALSSKFVIGAAIVQTIGVLALNFGLSRESGSGAIVIALSATYPVLTIILALRHFKEELKPIPLGGALIGITGIIVLTLS